MKLLMLIFSVVISTSLYAQKNCEVDVEALSGTYEGDCKKGLANGIGTAQGTDTYKGKFKKGLPHGAGAYTWANGDKFVGEFSRGLKEGEGQMIVKTAAGVDSTYSGYWRGDEYIGLDKYPYKTLVSDPRIVKIQYNKLNSDGNSIAIKYQQRNQNVQHSDISINNIQGSFSSVLQNPYKKEIVNVIFPFQAIIAGQERWEFQITQPGNWEIVVSITE